MNASHDSPDGEGYVRVFDPEGRVDAGAKLGASQCDQAHAMA
jgi:hypothetical protein